MRDEHQNMSEFAKMDIFFLVTTIAVVLLGLMIGFVLFRIWRILGHVEKFSQEVSEESALLRADVAHLRTNIRSEGFKLAHLTRFARTVMGRMGPKKKSDE